MSSKRRKGPREKDLTGRYLSGNLDEDRVDAQQRFSDRTKHAQQRKIERTALLRAAEEAESGELESLPAGEVIQVYSLYYDVENAGTIYLCVVRKTLLKLAETSVVVGDRVRFRATGSTDESGRPEAVIEQVLPRETLLVRAASFKGQIPDPIVANAHQLLIVGSVRNPRVKWGLVDRMLVAARSGRLEPILCLNKVDLAATPVEPEELDEEEAAYPPPLEVLDYYQQALGITTLRTSAATGEGLEQLKAILEDRVTVLAGHSGVGKSSLINSIEPTLDIRIGDVSDSSEKGRHTTTSARRYPLSLGGAVIDTPGVKVFGLWAVTEENLLEHFPDVASDTAPAWRLASYRRILESLG